MMISELKGAFETACGHIIHSVTQIERSFENRAAAGEQVNVESELLELRKGLNQLLANAQEIEDRIDRLQATEVS